MEVSEVQENGQTEHNISLFYSIYCKADTSNRLIKLDLFQTLYHWFKFFKINSNIFYCPSTGTTDDTVSSLVMFKSAVYFVICKHLFSWISSSCSEGCSPLLLVIGLYSRKVMELGFCLVLVVLAGVSQAAPYHSLAVVVGEVCEKGQMEHEISYVFITI